jgi:hypothetical protein
VQWITSFIRAIEDLYHQRLWAQAPISTATGHLDHFPEAATIAMLLQLQVPYRVHRPRQGHNICAVSFLAYRWHDRRIRDVLRVSLSRYEREWNMRFFYEYCFIPQLVQGKLAGGPRAQWYILVVRERGQLIITGALENDCQESSHSILTCLCPLRYRWNTWLKLVHRHTSSKPCFCAIRVACDLFHNKAIDLCERNESIHSVRDVVCREVYSDCPILL